MGEDKVEDWVHGEGGGGDWFIAAVGEALDWLDITDYTEVSGPSFVPSARRPNAHGGLHRRPDSASLQPLSIRNQKYYGHIQTSSLEMPDSRINPNMSNYVATGIRDITRESLIGHVRNKRGNRKTAQQVFDDRTFRSLVKVINKGVLDFVYGCISTGKEARVHYATRSDGHEFAVKLFKTITSTVDGEDKYVQGDPRFSRGCCRSNKRKLKEILAEKEMRNLLRMKAAGIRCPTPYHLRDTILVMEFIGSSGQAAPRLKNAALSIEKLCEAYVEIVMEMRTLYQKCKLVHGDLNEYNILVFEGHLNIIDVSLAVERDHPLAKHLLWQDCTCIFSFFRKQGVAAMSTRELFLFVTDDSIDNDSVDRFLEQFRQRILAREDSVDAKDDVEDTIFFETNVCTKVEGMKNFNDNSREIPTSNVDNRMTTAPTMTPAKCEPQQILNSKNKSCSSEISANADTDAKYNSDDPEERELCKESVSDSDSSGSSSETKVQNTTDRKAARKENKRKLKEEKREARKNKVPKAVKKRRKKLSKPRKTR